MPTSPAEPDPTQLPTAEPDPNSPEAAGRAESARGLVVDGLSAGYGGNIVVRKASLTVRVGEIAAVIGPNGSGKSTLLKAITGGIPVSGGRVVLDGVDVTGRERHLLARQGMAYLPQENEVFRSLTVRENLEIGGYRLPRTRVAAAVQRVLEQFPRLAGMQSRTAGHLSGGERKILAVGRILMLRPSTVVLDEPSVGLAPPASRALLEETVRALAATGAAVLLVEQRAVQALQVADRAHVMVAGRIVRSGPAAELGARGDLGGLFFGTQPPPAPV